jgi:cell division protein FtsI (penicillin-binding protein 3)/stage V sporulation protein D (sporulation-specific penicillin-binding protein)
MTRRTLPSDIEENRGSEKGFFRNWRINLLFLSTLALCALVIKQLYLVQIVDHEIYEAKAQDQHQFFKEIKANRGQIYIRDGEDNYIPVATNEELNQLVIVPKQITDTEGVTMTLASSLLMEEDEIRDKVYKEDDPYELIKKKLTKEESNLIQEKKMQGVQLIPKEWRHYPENKFASHVIGFVGYRDNKRVGQYGIEGYFNDILEGEEGFIKSQKDIRGKWISTEDRILERPKNGADIVLTIDQSIQYFVENLLERSVEKFEADSGSIMVMNPKNGKILAMANYPNFDSNRYNEVEDISVLKNNCISEAYEPGSIFKPITASMAIDLGVLGPNSTYIDKGEYEVAGFTIKNSDEKAYGEVTMTRFLELSLNTGAIFAMQSVGQANFLDYLKKYGFNQKTEVDLSGEISGNINNLNYDREINYVTASFGQGISLTPIQLVTAFSSLVNGGELLKPQIIEEFRYDDDATKPVEKEVVRRVIKETTSNQIKSMLVSVVKNGWGEKAAVPGYLVGGKTGTAQVADSENAGYSDKTIHSFIGFAPAKEPRFVTLVKLNNVKNEEFSAYSAGVATGKLNEFLLDYYQIFPTEEIDEKEVKEFQDLMDGYFLEKNMDENNDDKKENEDN